MRFSKNQLPPCIREVGPRLIPEPRSKAWKRRETEIKRLGNQEWKNMSQFQKDTYLNLAALTLAKIDTTIICGWAGVRGTTFRDKIQQ